MDQSCEGHSDLLSGMSYLAESEEDPSRSGNKTLEKFHRGLPPPGKEVAADALYTGDDKATKIPDGGGITIFCYCEKKIWKTRMERSSLSIPFTNADEFKDWRKGDPRPPTWPGMGDNLEPNSGDLPGPILPPLDPHEPFTLGPINAGTG